MHNFYIAEIPDENASAELEERDWKHLFKTLRAKPGEKIGLMDGKGSAGEAIVENGGTVRVLSRKVFEKPSFGMHLFIAPPRRNKMDDLLRQCAEIGFASINPVMTERSVSAPEKDSIDGRWKTILTEACKQSGNPFLPELRRPILFSDAISLIAAKGMDAFYGSPRGNSEGFPQIRAGKDIAWIVGPEGGFTEKEEKLMEESSFRSIRIGSWTLRVETAALCGGAVLFAAARNQREKNISHTSPL